MTQLDRRAFLGAGAAIGLSSLPAWASAQDAAAPAGGAGTGIRPFHVHFPDTDLAELRRRIRATRWPERETVDDGSQGVPLAVMQDLARYWASDYDWRKCEARLNALPQFLTRIDGLDIHFIHVRSKHENALPLIVTHGWPGSVIEQLKIIDPLVNPTAHGGTAADAFHLVIPSLPGFGFSGKPTTNGWDAFRTARAWRELMTRLGYRRFVAQGGDLGAGVATALALQSTPELLGIHVNLPATIPPDVAKALQAGDPPRADFSADEKLAYEELALLFAKRRIYAAMMQTRPQTLYGLVDSPIGLASWIIDHPDGFGQPAVAMTAALTGHPGEGPSVGALTRDDILDDITLYWLTNTAISSARYYWQSKLSLYNATDVNVPAAVSVFPGEGYQAPRSWTERAYHQLVHYNRLGKGGHYPAWEQPEIFVGELRASFQSMRGT